MDIIAIKRLMEALIKEYESTETHCILFYSTDHPRDFKILKDKIEKYRTKLDKLLGTINDDGSNDIKKDGINTGEEDIRTELL